MTETFQRHIMTKKMAKCSGKDDAEGMADFFKRTWAEIDLDALAHNYKEIRKRVQKNAKIMCVVKADAYGHGVEHVAPFLQEQGADWFAVSNLEEAIHLRNCGIVRPILILGYTPPEYAASLARYGITQALLSLGYAQRLSSVAQQAGVEVEAHVKLDTGMSRVGFYFQQEQRDQNAMDEIAKACTLPGIHADGIFTHFAVSDEGAEGKEFTFRQFQLFTTAIRQLESRGIVFALRHCANSGAILSYPEMHLDMVRPGIIQYGLAPSGKLSKSMDFHPVMSLRSVVSQLKTVEPGATLSYGREYTASVRSQIATIPVGYADGYQRVMAGKASVLVHGKRVPLVGRVCMDQMMADVSSVPSVQEGDTVTLFGRDGKEAIPVEELSGFANTINYEMVCLVTKRVPRIYMRQGTVTAISDCLCDFDEL